MITALYIEKKGVYSIPGIDGWDKDRDARLYKGPNKVIAHSPCERWGRYWSGGPSAKIKRKLGDDGGCFEHALSCVRAFGGILEHPEASHAFKFFDLPIPKWHGGWTPLDKYGGRSCCVSQGNYGHLARKMTWLYGVNIKFDDLIWGPTKGKMKFEMSPRSKEAAILLRSNPDRESIKRLSVYERKATPVQFRDLLIRLVS